MWNIVVFTLLPPYDSAGTPKGQPGDYFKRIQQAIQRVRLGKSHYERSEGNFWVVLTFYASV